LDFQPAFFHRLGKVGMKYRRMLVLVPLFVGFGVAVLATPRTDVRHLDADLVLRRGLMLPCAGSCGRRPLVVNPVFAAWATQDPWPPNAGEKVKLTNGSTVVWEPIDAKPEGYFESPRLNGAFCFFTVHCPSARVMMLEAKGHLLAMLNNEPLEGDLYGLGRAQYPVQLKAGPNHLLFLMPAHGTRLQAKFTRPKKECFFLPDDATVASAVAGRPYKTWAAIPVINATNQTLSGLTLTAAAGGEAPITTPVPPIPPLSLRKVAFALASDAPLQVPLLPHASGKWAFRFSALAPGADRKIPFTMTLQRLETGQTLDSRRLEVEIVQPTEPHRRTFRSAIDGSVQQFAYCPPRLDGASRSPPGLLLTLHGSGKDALEHLQHYQPKPWCHLVAPTNRRPYGFDWEDWGRLDALEVLEQTLQEQRIDRRRVWLTGHSMGGHGTWHLGALYPDRFAALAPSAGWICFTSYASGHTKADTPTPLQELVWRSSTPSDTVALAENLLAPGIYILHGSKDANVPVQQARRMREVLGKLKKKHEYHEQPGAAHWWGHECVDWPPLMEFLALQSLPAPENVHEVRFATASPGVSGQCHWVTVQAQEKLWQLSQVHLQLALGQRRIQGITRNVSRLSLDLTKLLPPGQPIHLELDRQKLPPVPWPLENQIWLQRTAGRWTVIPKPSGTLKGPHRYGGFRDAFRHRFLFVYGTKGTPQENAWALAKARYEASIFWYRGNGSIDILPDHAFDPAAEPDRNVILFGNADTNSAWPALLNSCPVQFHRGRIQCGEQSWEGDDLGGMFIYPRPGSDTACVGVLGGSGLPGLRTITFMPIFVSGTPYPDCLIVDSTMLSKGWEGVRCAGYFGLDWQVQTGEFFLP
jgi:predicted esterase